MRPRTLRTVAVFPKALAAWRVGTLLAAVVAIEPRPRGRAISLARIGFARARIRPGIGLLARSLRAIGLAGIGPFITIASVGLSGIGLASQATPGELLFRASRRARSAPGFTLVARGPIRPATRARIVIVVIAGHE
ncbi:hypothetical protein NWI01_04260 [Nitrobacter winogradskyi]|uniref:Uncharacterized protein n=1 Tax=Nitrobacter winogradskyi TaxID=913 RepID=A0A4Y3W6B8_NITWI|nr:hypothetical protein NWI01_04260 [Nitrobacter winogradskyi]